VAEGINLKQISENSGNVDRMTDTSNEYESLSRKPLVEWQLKKDGREKTGHEDSRSTKLAQDSFRNAETV
jgi:hypothetical protein